MNEKEQLIALIKQKGNCYEPIDINCNECQLDNCLIRSSQDRSYNFKNNFENKCNSNYKQAVKIFIERYDEEELMEVLL